MNRLLTCGAAAFAAAISATACAENLGGLEREEGRPLETIDGVASHYGSVDVGGGARLRTIITIPEGAEEPLHPLLFTQWVSCGSVEIRPNGRPDVLRTLAQESGLALIRVERSSDGDSVGPACDELDYDTEVAHYVAAFTELLQDERVDASKVFVYGSSLGSTTAPLVAKSLQDAGYDIAGVAVQGGGAETYLERMITFDRIYLERRPNDVDPSAIHDEMNNRIRFHYEYLINDRHPDDIAKDSAAMAAVRADVRGLGETNQYGRPFAWHQQAAKQNFLAAWAAIDAPVLVIFNAFDQFEAQYGADVIVDTVNRLRPGTATLIVRPNVGHSDDRFETIIDAYADEGGEPAWREKADMLVAWYRDHN
jgi:pimeloyl-ACP methyl ester carboxylesterase